MTRDRPRPSPAGLVALLLVVAGVVVSLWRPEAPALPPVDTRLDRLPAEVAAAIDAYRTPRRAVGIALQVVAVAVPVLLVVTAGGRRLVDRLAGTRHAGWRGPLRGALVAVGVGVLLALVRLPGQAWAGLVQDGAWQVRTASAAAWWGRVATATALELVVLALAGAGVVWLARRRPGRWHLDAVWVGTVAVALVTLLWPTVVLPLTTPVRDLGDSVQAQAVRATVDESGLSLPVVVQERSRRDTRSNAVVHGIGPTRRMVIDDTLLARPVAEVVAVVAHELAHQQHRDVERAVLASSILVGVLAVAVRMAWTHPAVRRRLGHWRDAAPDDPRLVAVALAVLAVVGLVAEPVALWQSRRVEASADATAHDLGAEPATTVQLQRRLAIDNLSPLAVPTWERLLWWSHPTPAQRIRAAVARAQVEDAPLPSLGDLQSAEAADPPAWSRPGR